MEKIKKHPVYTNIPSSRHLDHNVYFNGCRMSDKKNIFFLYYFKAFNLFINIHAVMGLLTLLLG